MTREFERVVLVTRRTALEELVERFGTRDQARFYIEHMGLDFSDYQAADAAYQASLGAVRSAIPDGVRVQVLDRELLPTYTFRSEDLVVVLGQDGLVVNAAKYVAGQPVVAINPDPARIDGVLLPFQVRGAAAVLRRVLTAGFQARAITMAAARLNDGQVLHAVNDLFVGQRTHVSARYHLRLGGRDEEQSSSGVIVSTGAGSTGWFRSVVTGASGISEAVTGLAEVREARERYRFDWEAPYLLFTVREPFVSRVSGAELVYGRIAAGEALEVVSRMPQGGVIFGDGVERDFLEFNSGAVARIGVSDQHLNLVVAAS